ncbi:hypothetical protein LTR85_005621 [Meristemomyces frigidus]|nr:hypothetical protein LTR85_005621 [Meristemomyces frigidus]
MTQLRSRLLALPPELRIHVYSFLFQIVLPKKPAATNIDILTLGLDVPWLAAITATNRQPRAETLALYHHAVQTLDAFWSSHSFYLTIDIPRISARRGAYKDVRALVRQCAGIPMTAAFRSLDVHVKAVTCTYRVAVGLIDGGVSLTRQDEGYSPLRDSGSGEVEHRGMALRSLVNGRDSLDLYSIAGSVCATHGLPVVARIDLLNVAHRRTEGSDQGVMDGLRISVPSISAWGAIGVGQGVSPWSPSRANAGRAAMAAFKSEDAKNSSGITPNRKAVGSASTIATSQAAQARQRTARAKRTSSFFGCVVH